MARLIDASGVIVFDGTIENGGSQPVEVVSFPFAFDTPGITAGIDLGYTTVVGDVLGSWLASVPTTVFDGTVPFLSFYVDGFDPFTESLSLISLGVLDSSVGNGTADVGTSSQNTLVVFDTAAALKAKLINASTGGDPGSTMGEGRITIQVLKVQ